MDFFTNQPAASASASASRTPVEAARSGLAKVSASRKVRLACDRCHTQKLRCVRKPHQASCERCIRLKNVCRFGPRAPRASLKVRQQDKNREHGTSPNPPFTPTAADSPDNNSPSTRGREPDVAEDQATTHLDLYHSMTGNFDGMQDIDWSSLRRQSGNLDILQQDGFGYLEAPSWCENTHPSAENPFERMFDPNLGVESHKPSDESESVSASTVRKLADLNVALFDCAAKFSTSVGDSASPMGDGIRVSRKSAILVFDELFRLTADFVEVIRSISGRGSETCTHSPSRSPEQDVAHTEWLNSANTPQTSQLLSMNTDRLQYSPFSGVNEGTLLMIVSCHSHLIEMYTTVFEMIRACIEHSLAPKMGENWAVILPRLQVGSIATPPVQVDVRNPLPATKSSMYMLMVVMLSSQLWEQLANLVSAERDFSAVSTSKLHRTFKDTIWDVLTERTNSLSQTIDATRNMLH